MDFGSLTLVIYIGVFAFSVSFHEASHALVAWLLGDPTGKYEGRISLNPMKHLDMVGFLFLIFAKFGWAKPVPINPRNFEHPRLHSAISASAGPLSNILLAILALNISRFVPDEMTIIHGILSITSDVNILLAAFNLIPIFPLDGEKIIRLFVPRRFQDPYDLFMAHGPLILFGMLGLGFVFGVHILWNILVPIMAVIETIVQFLVFYT